MAVQYLIATGSTALVAATAKTVIEGTTGSSVPCTWIAVDISFDGVTAGNTPVKVEFMTFTTTGTGTGYTPKRFGQTTGVATSTWKINDSVEPSTAINTYQTWNIPPTSGIFYQWPLGREFAQPVSTLQVIRLTAAQVVNYQVNLYIEE